MIRTIFFDLDGTLRHNLPSGGEFFADYAIQLGLRATSEDRLRAMRWEHFYWANSPELKADRQAFPDDGAFWNLYSRRQLVALGATDALAYELAPKISAYMYQFYKPRSVAAAGVAQVLQALQERGCVLGVISNREKPYQDEIEALGLAPFFRLALAAGEVRMWKPEPQIFVHACQQLGCRASEAAYVGDNYFADVIGARRAGLEPVLYDPRGIFPDAGCATIAAFEELPAALRLNGRPPG
jgi:HAD superfamily hydrolase (TIGR01549 family)